MPESDYKNEMETRLSEITSDLAVLSSQKYEICGCITDDARLQIKFKEDWLYIDSLTNRYKAPGRARLTMFKKCNEDYDSRCKSAVSRVYGSVGNITTYCVVTGQWWLASQC